MPQTKTFSVTAVSDVPITAQCYTPVIQIQEDPGVTGWPTCAFLVKKPTSSDQGITVAQGQAYQFTRPGGGYLPGDIAGWVRLAVGASPTTFSQDES